MPKPVDVGNTSSSCVAGSNRHRRDNRRDQPPLPPPPRAHAPLMSPALLDVRPRPRVPRTCRYAASVAHVGSADRKKAGGAEEKSRCGSHILVREAAGTGQQQEEEQGREPKRHTHDHPANGCLVVVAVGGAKRSPSTRFHWDTIGRLVVVQLDPGPILDFIIPIVQHKRCSNNQTSTQRRKQTNAQQVRNATNTECVTSTGQSHIESA